MAKRPLSQAKVKQLLSKPGTRAALADKYLSPAQLKQRQLNQRLNAPVTQGSSLTNRELAHQAQTATNVQYGPSESALNQKLNASRQMERDQGGWYDQYLAELRQRQQNASSINQRADQAFQNLTGAVGRLGTGVEGTNTQGEAANAAAVRQALLGSFAGLQGETGRNMNQYTDALSHVVGPGQKLTAQAQGRRNTNSVRDQLADLAREMGQYNQKYRADAVANEAKNVLAQQALGLDIQKAQTQAAQNSPEGKAATAAATSEAQTAAKYGRTVHQWRMLGPDGRSKVIKASKSKPADSVYSSGPFAGRKKSEIEAMSPGGRQTLIDRYNKNNGSGTGQGKGTTTKAADDFYNKYGVKPASQAAVAKAQNSIDTAKTWIGTVKESNPGMSSRDILGLLTRGQAADKKSGAVAIPAQNSLWVQVALDLAGPTHRISNSTANRLHHAGYSVKSLGLPSMTGVITSPIKGGKGAGQ